MKNDQNTHSQMYQDLHLSIFQSAPLLSLLQYILLIIIKPIPSINKITTTNVSQAIIGKNNQKQSNGNANPNLINPIMIAKQIAKINPIRGI